MLESCPYGHQLCSDKHLCRITPVQVNTWWEEAKKLHPLVQDRDGKIIHESSTERARYERVQDHVKRCKQARPFMTTTPPEQLAMFGVTPPPDIWGAGVR